MGVGGAGCRKSDRILLLHGFLQGTNAVEFEKAIESGREVKSDCSRVHWSVLAIYQSEGWLSYD